MFKEYSAWVTIVHLDTSCSGTRNVPTQKHEQFKQGPYLLIRFTQSSKWVDFIDLQHKIHKMTFFMHLTYSSRSVIMPRWFPCCQKKLLMPQNSTMLYRKDHIFAVLLGGMCQIYVFNVLKNIKYLMFYGEVPWGKDTNITWWRVLE